MPKYGLEFVPQAAREWAKLDGSIQLQFVKILRRRLEVPRAAQAALTGMPDCYKIKLRTLGYRLVYRVEDNVLIVLVLAIGKRDREEAYKAALARLAAKSGRVGEK